MKLELFEYLEPHNLSEASLLLAKYPREAKILAGGTDLIVRLKRRQLYTKYIVNIKKIDGMKDIGFNGNVFSIGALATISDIAESETVKKNFPILQETALSMASPQIRNIATVAGNLCNASPAADMAPPLLCLDAVLKIKSAYGERQVKLSQFFTGPGQNVLKPDEIVTEVMIPKEMKDSQGKFVKLEARKALDIAIISVAITNKGGYIRIALGAVAPTPIRAKKAEELLHNKKPDALLIEQAGRLASEETKPIDDVRGSLWYRKEMAYILVKRGLRRLLGI
jgi:carbon-monoxide dehydrogenase medium subunit